MPYENKAKTVPITMMDTTPISTISLTSSIVTRNLSIVHLKKNAIREIDMPILIRSIRQIFYHKGMSLVNWNVLTLGTHACLLPRLRIHISRIQILCKGKRNRADAVIKLREVTDILRSVHVFCFPFVVRLFYHSPRSLSTLSRHFFLLLSRFLSL